MPALVFEHTQQYRDVINSKRWKALRKRLLPKDNACAHCKKCGYDLQLHHKTYERLGAELDTDVEFLCPHCHAKADVVREKQGRQRSTVALYNARVAGFGRAKYGDNWDLVEDIDEQFDNWVERKNEYGGDE